MADAVKLGNICSTVCVPQCSGSVCVALGTKCARLWDLSQSGSCRYAGNELQMMLRRMVPSHPQADARKLAQRTQLSAQQQQQQQSQQLQQQPQDQLQVATGDRAFLDHTAVVIGPTDNAHAEEIVGGAMDPDKGELPPDDEEYSPDGVATAAPAPAQQPPTQPAAIEPPVRPTSDVSTTTDAAMPQTSAQPSNAMAAADPAPAQPSDGSLPPAGGGHAAADDGGAEAATGSEDTAKSRKGNGVGESAQSQPPSAPGRGELPELDEEVAATAMQVSFVSNLCAHICKA